MTTGIGAAGVQDITIDMNTSAGQAVPFFTGPGKEAFQADSRVKRVMEEATEAFYRE